MLTFQPFNTSSPIVLEFELVLVLEPRIQSSQSFARSPCGVLLNPDS
jgi:hypothetical protein